MPSKGRYTAGKQVSRWEASDSDNIDIEYKNLEGQAADTPFPSCTCPLGDKKGAVIKALVVTVMFGIGLVLGFLLRKSVEKTSVTPAVPNVPPYGIKQVCYVSVVIVCHVHDNVINTVVFEGIRNECKVNTLYYSAQRIQDNVRTCVLQYTI